MTLYKVLPQLNNNTLTELMIANPLNNTEIGQLIVAIPKCKKLQKVVLTVKQITDMDLIYDLFNILRATNITVLQLNGAPSKVIKGLELVCAINQCKKDILAHNKQLSTGTKLLFAELNKAFALYISDHTKLPQDIDAYYELLLEKIAEEFQRHTTPDASSSRSIVAAIEAAPSPPSKTIIKSQGASKASSASTSKASTASGSKASTASASKASTSSEASSINAPEVEDEPYIAATPELFEDAQSRNISEIEAWLTGGADINSPFTPNGDTALHFAAHHGYVRAIDILIKRGANIHLPQPDTIQYTALHIAAKSGNVEAINTLIKAGAKVETQNFNGFTSLHLAAENGHVKAIAVLIKGAKVDAYNKEGFTALHLAAEKGYVKAINVLIKAGANVETVGANGLTALHLAAHNGHAEVIKALINAGAKVADNTTVIALHIAAAHGHVEAINALVNEGAKVTTQDINGSTALHFAAAFGQAKAIGVLVKLGANIEAYNKEGFTALHSTAEHGHVKAINALIKVCANVNAGNPKGFTALHLAAQNGHAEAINTLVTAGSANVHACDPKGVTALHLAAKKGHKEAITALIKVGHAKVNACNKEGFTALHLAAERGHIEAIKVLIKLGANVKIQGITGRTALHIAAEHGHAEAIKVLINLGHATVEIQDITGRTALHFAAEHGHAEAIKALITVGGANIEIPTITGRIALHIAAEHGHAEAIKALITVGHAPVNVWDTKGFTALHIAAEHGHAAVIDALIYVGQANVNACNSDGFTALHIAENSRCTEAMERLINAAAKVETQDATGLIRYNVLPQLNNNTLTELMIADSLNDIEIRQLIVAIPKCIKLEKVVLTVKPNTDMRLIYDLLHISRATNITALQLNGAPSKVIKALNLVCAINQCKKDILSYNKELSIGTKLLFVELNNEFALYISDHTKLPQDIDAYYESLLKEIAKEFQSYTIPDASSSRSIVAAIEAAPSPSNTTIKSQEASQALSASASEASSKSSIAAIDDLFDAAQSKYISEIVAWLTVGSDINAPFFPNGDTALHFAAQNGYVSAIKILIAKDANVEIQKAHQYTALHLAVINKHIDVIEALIDARANVNAQCIGGVTALHLAAKSGHADAIKVLIKAGANVGIQDINGSTTLHSAAANGHVEIIKALILEGANVEACNSQLNTALHFAAARGQAKAIDALINVGHAKVNACNKEGFTALHRAAENGHAEVIEGLIKEGAHVEIQTPTSCCTALHLAAQKGHAEVIKALINTGHAKVNACNKEGFTALHLAAKHGHAEAIKALIKASATLETQDANKYTALHLAVMHEHIDVIEALIDARVNVNAQSKLEFTPLHIAVPKGNAGAINALIKAGANLDMQNVTGGTALHCAAVYGYVEIINALIKAGANVEVCNSQLNTALHLAAGNGQAKVIEVLIEAGAKVDAYNQVGYTALHIATEEKHGEAIKALITVGHANVDIKTPRGNTALQIAQKSGHTETIDAFASTAEASSKSSIAAIDDLFDAAQSKYIFEIEAWLAGGAKIDSPFSTNGDTALHFAAQNGYARAIKLLIAKGANIDACNKWGFTALQLVAENGHVEAINALINVGHANVEAANKHGFTALDMAVQKGHIDAVKTLLNNSASTIACGVLHVAVSHNYIAIAQLLLEKGAEVNAMYNGYSPLYFVTNTLLVDIKASERCSMIMLLLSHGANPTMLHSGNSNLTLYKILSEKPASNAKEVLAHLAKAKAELMESGKNLLASTMYEDAIKAYILATKISDICEEPVAVKTKLIGDIVAHITNHVHSFKTLHASTNAAQQLKQMFEDSTGQNLHKLCFGRIIEIIDIYLKDEAAVEYNNIGSNLYKENKFKEAIAPLEQASILNKQNPICHANLGNAYRKDGQFDNAISSLTTAIKLNGKNHKYHSTIALAYRDKGDGVKLRIALLMAKRCAQDALEQDPNNRVLQDAIKDIEANIKDINIPLIREEKSNTQSSQNVIEKASSASKATTKKASAVADIPLNTKDNSSSTPIHSKKASKLKSSPPITPKSQKEGAQASSSIGKDITTTPIKDDKPAEPPKTAVEYYRESKKHNTSREYTKAVAALKQAIEQEPNNPAWHNECGINYYELDEYDYAIAAYHIAIRQAPTRANYHDNLGSAYYALGQRHEHKAQYIQATEAYRQASEAYRGAIQIEDKNAVYHFNYGDALLKDTTIPEHAILAYIEYRKAFAIEAREEYRAQAQVAWDQMQVLQLRSWDLSNRAIGDNEMKYLVEALRNTRCIVLDLSRNNITEAAHETLCVALKGTSMIEVKFDNVSDRITRICAANRAHTLENIKPFFARKDLYEKGILTDALFEQLLYAPDLIEAIKDHIFSPLRVLKDAAFLIKQKQEVNFLAIKDKLIAKRLANNFRKEPEDKDIQDVNHGSTSTKNISNKAASGLDTDSAEQAILMNRNIVLQHMYNFDIVQSLKYIEYPSVMIELLTWTDISSTRLKTALQDDAIKINAFALCSKLLNIWSHHAHEPYYFNILFKELTATLDSKNKIEIGYACFKKVQAISCREIQLKEGIYRLATIALEGVENADAECYSNLGKAYYEIREYGYACRALDHAVRLLTPLVDKSPDKAGRKSATPPLSAAASKASTLAFKDEVTLITSELIDPTNYNTPIPDLSVKVYRHKEYSAALFDGRHELVEDIDRPDQREPSVNKLAECYFNLGKAYSQLEDPVSAAQSYHHAIDLDDGNNEYKQAVRMTKTKGKQLKAASAPMATKSAHPDDSCKSASKLDHFTQYHKKSTSADQDVSTINLSAHWIINGRDYCSDNRIIVECSTKIYAAIESQCLDTLDDARVGQFKMVLVKYVTRLHRQNGIKFLGENKYELKINDDARLFCDNAIFKNDNNDTLIIFNKYANDHGALAIMSKVSCEIKICPCTLTREISDLAVIIGETAEQSVFE